MRKYLLYLLCLCIPMIAIAEDGHMLNFPNVSAKELVCYVSKVAKANFIYDEKDLTFETSLVSGKPVNDKELISLLIRLLHKNQFSVKKQEGYYVIEKLLNRKNSNNEKEYNLEHRSLYSNFEEEILATYKLQYHLGSEIQAVIKSIPFNQSPKLKRAIASMQWVEATNTLIFAADNNTIQQVKKLIKQLDVAKKQVFIEVLVIETDVNNGLDFGLEWSALGKYKDSFSGGINNKAPNIPSSKMLSSISQVQSEGLLSGAIPKSNGFNLGVIGDIILHKGNAFLTLSSLISALQSDRDSTIVLNQKIITQDNENSTIFVGDNIPFTGSVVETIGSSQQTTANVEYRDVGVNLNITPLIGDEDIITLEIKEEISEALPHMLTSTTNISGIQTTKTNMSTKVHVPDQHFLILSGMIRDSKRTHKTGIPCLGGLPLIGAAFSKNVQSKEKRNVIIFVRPQLIHNKDEYAAVSQTQSALFQKQAPSAYSFEKGLDLVE